MSLKLVVGRSWIGYWVDHPLCEAERGILVPFFKGNDDHPHYLVVERSYLHNAAKVQEGVLEERSLQEQLRIFSKKYGRERNPAPKACNEDIVRTDMKVSEYIMHSFYCSIATS